MAKYFHQLTLFSRVHLLRSIPNGQSLEVFQEALSNEEVVVGFADEVPESRGRLNGESGEFEKQQKQRLQCQTDRLRQEAQNIRDRVIGQVKRKQAQFKESRKQAARLHKERKASHTRWICYRV